MANENPSVIRRPAANILVVCAVCRRPLPAIIVPREWVLVCTDCWRKLRD